MASVGGKIPFDPNIIGKAVIGRLRRRNRVTKITYRKEKCRLILTAVMVLTMMLLGWWLVKAQGSAMVTRTIRVGYIDCDGFFEEQSDGTYTGYGVEYLDEICKHTGWEYELVYDTWENHFQNLDSGKIDFLCHAYRTEQREKKYLFSDYSVGTDTSVLYGKNDGKEYYYNDYESLDGMKIAMLKGTSQKKFLRDFAKEKGFHYTTAYFGTAQECFEALDQGEVDSVAIGSLSFQKDYKVICRFSLDPFYIMTSRKNQELMNQLNDTLGEIKTSVPSFEADLYDKYYGSSNALSSVLFTREEKKYIDSIEPITIALLPSRKPFSYYDEEGNIKGIVPDIIKEISQRSGLKYRLEMLPSGMEPIQYLKEHPETYLAGINADNPRFKDKSFLLSNVFYSDDVALVCKMGTKYSMDSSYVLAVPKSYTALKSYIQTNHSEFQIVECESTAECMKMVLDGKVDFTAQNINVVTPLLENPHYDGMMVLPTFFMEERLGMVTSKTESSQVVMGIIDKCIKSLSETELSQIAVNHTINNGYRMTLGDLVYKLRYTLIVVAVLVVACIIMLVSYLGLRQRSYRALETKNRQLVEMAQKAEDASHAKGQFLACMSHEIRTPMNAIVGMTTLAQQHINQQEKLREYLGKIELSSKVLLGLVNDLLDMSAIESNKMQIAHEPFDLSKVLDAVAVMYETQCNEKGIRLKIDGGNIQHNQLVGDAFRFNQILVNLVSNAIKFTSEGEINLTVEESGVEQDRVSFRFQITDTGEGMTEDMQNRLFQPFEQENAQTAKKHGGSGLGLSITKRLTEQMGGTISCHSQKGIGTTFIINVSFQIDTEWEVRSEKKQYDFQGRKILLAEDTAFNADVVTDLLDMVNMKVEHVENGQLAVERFEMAQEGTYQAILMDVQMPVMNGYEAAQQIRTCSHPQAKSILIYAMTANAFTEDVEAAKAAGMDGHIAKPIDAEILYETLWKGMEKHE